MSNFTWRGGSTPNFSGVSSLLGQAQNSFNQATKQASDLAQSFTNANQAREDKANKSRLGNALKIIQQANSNDTFQQDTANVLASADPEQVPYLIDALNSRQKILQGNQKFGQDTTLRNQDISKGAFEAGNRQEQYDLDKTGTLLGHAKDRASLAKSKQDLDFNSQANPHLLSSLQSKAGVDAVKAKYAEQLTQADLEGSQLVNEGRGLQNSYDAVRNQYANDNFSLSNQAKREQILNARHGRSNDDARLRIQQAKLKLDQAQNTRSGKRFAMEQKEFINKMARLESTGKVSSELFGQVLDMAEAKNFEGAQALLNRMSVGADKDTLKQIKEISIGMSKQSNYRKDKTNAGGYKGNFLNLMSQNKKEMKSFKNMNSDDLEAYEYGGNAVYDEIKHLSPRVQKRIAGIAAQDLTTQVGKSFTDTAEKYSFFDNSGEEIWRNAIVKAQAETAAEAQGKQDLANSRRAAAIDAAKNQK